MAKPRVHHPYPVAVATFADGTIIRRSIGQELGKPIDRERAETGARLGYQLNRLMKLVRYVPRHDEESTVRYFSEDLGGAKNGSPISVPFVKIRWEARDIPPELNDINRVQLGPKPVSLEFIGEHATTRKAKRATAAPAPSADLLPLLLAAKSSLESFIRCQGGCDHSRGICFCKDIAIARQLGAITVEKGNVSLHSAS